MTESRKSRLWPGSLLPSRAVVLLCVVAVLSLAYMIVYIQDDPVDGLLLGVKFPDFQVFYSSGPALNEGGIQLLFDVDRFTAFQQAFLSEWITESLDFRPWLYPPPMLLFTAPLVLLPFIPAALLVQAAGAAALFFAFGRRLMPALIVVASPAFALNFVSGQNSALWAACFVGGLHSVATSPRMAGVALGLLLLKPQLAMLIPVALLAARAYRSLAYMMGTGVGLLFLSLIFPGGEAWREFLDATRGPAMMLERTALLRVGAMMGSAQAAVRIVGGAPMLATIVQLATSVTAVVLTIAIVRRLGTTPLAILAMAPLALIASPYWMSYDLVIVGAALVLFMLQHDAVWPPLPAELLWGLIWLLPFLVFRLNLAGAPLASPILMALIGMVAWKAWRNSRGENEVRIAMGSN